MIPTPNPSASRVSRNVPIPWPVAGLRGAAVRFLPESIVRPVGVWISWAAGLIVLYVLSVGPVLKWVGGPFRMPPALHTFYHPLSEVLKRDGPPAYLLRSYIDFCGVRNDPRTGQLKD